MKILTGVGRAGVSRLCPATRAPTWAKSAIAKRKSASTALAE
jgi:hypothetical protein